MKLSDIKVDVAKREEGEWVDDIPDMPGLRVKVRGINNRDWRKLRDRLIQSVPRHKRINGSLPPEDSDRINGTLLRDAALLDWEGLEDDKGDPLPYSKEQATEYLLKPDYEPFRDAVMWAAIQVGERRQNDIEDAAKN